MEVHINQFFRHRATRIILALFLALQASAAALSQETQVKYQRKSISYIDAVLAIGEAAYPSPPKESDFLDFLLSKGRAKNVALSSVQEAILLETIRAQIEMPRFDYNPLPETLLVNFKEEIHAREVHSADSFAAVIEEVLLPEIVRILDYEKEIRALGLVSEEDRHSFVVEKAKETGITAEDLEAIMNSAYVYVPMVSLVRISEDTSKNKLSLDLHGGIFWYAVRTDTAGSRLALLERRETEASGSSDGAKSRILYAGKYLSAEDRAFTDAAMTLAANLEIATREIDEFQLFCPLTETGPGWVKFSLGKKEGLEIDDKYIIAEYQERPDGSAQQNHLGMVRVSKVADNRENDADSRARTVIGGGYQRGMQAIEHPRLDTDVSFRFALLPLNIRDGVATVAGDTHFVFEHEAPLFPALQLFLQENIASVTHQSQLFFAGYLEGGLAVIPDAKAFGEDFPMGLYWGAGLGWVKKVYINRLHLGLEALGSYTDLRFEGTAASGDQDWEWRLRSLGVTLNANLEIALTYDLNFGFGASYRLFTAFNYSVYRYEGDEKWLANTSDLSFRGWGFQLYFTYSLPSW